jgi:hypothetical protein
MTATTMMLAKGVTHPAVQTFWWAPRVVIVVGVLGYVSLVVHQHGFSLRTLSISALALACSGVVGAALLVAVGRRVDFDPAVFFFLAPVIFVAIFVASEMLFRVMLAVASRSSRKGTVAAQIPEGASANVPSVMAQPN